MQLVNMECLSCIPCISLLIKTAAGDLFLFGLQTKHKEPANKTNIMCVGRIGVACNLIRLLPNQRF